MITFKLHFVIYLRSHSWGELQMSGAIVKKRTRSELELKRSLLTREYVLHLNKNLCDGCGLCAANCPKETIKWTPARVVNGRLTKKPTIDFDIGTCIMCGECAMVCPLDAIKMTIDGQEIATIVKNEAFPVLLKEIKVTNEKCRPECNFICQTECPTKAITVTKSSSGRKKQEALAVHVDESLCIFCKRCELTCPFEAIEVKKPFQGTVQIDVDHCPEGCMACVDICPAHALQVGGDKKPSFSSQYCVYCFACQKVCPEENIIVRRDWIFHSDVRSAAWLTALKKLTSVETVLKEVASDSGKHRLSATEARAHGELDEQR